MQQSDFEDDVTSWAMTAQIADEASQAHQAAHSAKSGVLNGRLARRHRFMNPSVHDARRRL
jgi:hypothetical protein